MYTDKTKLVGEILMDSLSIANFSETAPQFEDKVLNDLLGYELYATLQANDTVEKYTDLLDGTTYTDTDGYLKEVKGIKEMLPYFFFFYASRDLESYNTSAGEFSANAQNAGKAPANLQRKLTHAYNKGVDMYYQLYYFIAYKNSQESDSYYENWDFKPLRSINVFGI